MPTITGTLSGEVLTGEPLRPADGSLILLSGDAGNDTLIGFGGYWNVADYGTSPRAILANLVFGLVNDGFGSQDALTDIVSIRGSRHNDTLLGGFGSVWIRLEGMAGADTIEGRNTIGNGVSYASSPAGVVVNLATGTASDGWGATDTLLNVVRLLGSNHADSLTGTATDNWFSASFGSDTIDGAGGFDSVDYGTITGRVPGVTVTFTSDGSATVVKGRWTDSLIGIESVKGTFDADRLTGWAGATQDIFLDGNAGADTIDGARNIHNLADYTGSTNGVEIQLQTAGRDGHWSGVAFSGIDTDTLVDVAAVRGSNFGDTITGSSRNDVFEGWYGNDSLDGGAGVDTARYALDKGQAVWSRSPDGIWTVTSPFGTDMLRSIEFLQFQDESVQLRAPTDFDGNGRSDILFSNNTLTWEGTPYVGGLRWEMNGTTIVDRKSMPDAGSGWFLRFTGDFNGDGKADLLWQHTDGLGAVWLMNGSNYLGGATFYTSGVDPVSTVAGVGDFNRDGRDDVLFSRQVTFGGEAVTELFIRSMDGYVAIGDTSLGAAGPGWSLAGTADFNGDAYADMLWRHANGDVAMWLSDGTGWFAGTTLTRVDLAWSIAGTGDFNGDGRSDIAWTRTTGEVAIWLMDGTNVVGSGTLSYNPGPSWHVAGVGDYNGDGKSDLLWRQDTAGSSDISIWLMDGLNGIGSGMIDTMSNDWRII